MSNFKGAIIRSADRAILWSEFTLLLPLLARLPLRLGYLLAAWRGAMNWLFDREWRSIYVGHRYIRNATNQAMKQVLPGLSTTETRKLTRRRFEGNSREEFEAHLLFRERLRQLNFLVKGLESVREQSEKGRGVILLSMHFDSFILGIVRLGMSGLVVNVMSSEIVEHPSVDSNMRRFFSRKYRKMERYLQGGKIVHVEQNLRFFYRALLNGECVVIMADLPATRKEGDQIWMRFLGRERSFMPGAFRLARATGSALAGFVCQWDGENHYTVTLSKCVPPEDVNEASYQGTYDFLEDAIRLKPERWWAADLLRAFKSR